MEERVQFRPDAGTDPQSIPFGEANPLLASRDVAGGINWVKDNKEDENIAKSVEKAKKAFAGCEIKGKKLGVIGLGAIGAEVANAAASLGMEVYGYIFKIHFNPTVKHILRSIFIDNSRHCTLLKFFVNRKSVYPTRNVAGSEQSHKQSTLCVALPKTVFQNF